MGQSSTDLQPPGPDALALERARDGVGRGPADRFAAGGMVGGGDLLPLALFHRVPCRVPDALGRADTADALRLGAVARGRPRAAPGRRRGRAGAPWGDHLVLRHRHLVRPFRPYRRCPGFVLAWLEMATSNSCAGPRRARRRRCARSFRAALPDRQPGAPADADTRRDGGPLGQPGGLGDPGSTRLARRFLPEALLQCGNLALRRIHGAGARRGQSRLVPARSRFQGGAVAPARRAGRGRARARAARPLRRHAGVRGAPDPGAGDRPAGYARAAGDRGSRRRRLAPAARVGQAPGGRGAGALRGRLGAPLAAPDRCLGATLAGPRDAPGWLGPGRGAVRRAV